MAALKRWRYQPVVREGETVERRLDGKARDPLLAAIRAELANTVYTKIRSAA